MAQSAGAVPLAESSGQGQRKRSASASFASASEAPVCSMNVTRQAGGPADSEAHSSELVLNKIARTGYTVEDTIALLAKRTLEKNTEKNYRSHGKKIKAYMDIHNVSLDSCQNSHELGQLLAKAIRWTCLGCPGYEYTGKKDALSKGVFRQVRNAANQLYKDHCEKKGWVKHVELHAHPDFAREYGAGLQALRPRKEGKLTPPPPPLHPPPDPLLAVSHLLPSSQALVKKRSVHEQLDDLQRGQALTLQLLAKWLNGPGQAGIPCDGASLMSTLLNQQKSELEAYLRVAAAQERERRLRGKRAQASASAAEQQAPPQAVQEDVAAGADMLLSLSAASLLSALHEKGGRVGGGVQQRQLRAEPRAEPAGDQPAHRAPPATGRGAVQHQVEASPERGPVAAPLVTGAEASVTTAVTPPPGRASAAGEGETEEPGTADVELTAAVLRRLERKIDALSRHVMDAAAAHHHRSQCPPSGIHPAPFGPALDGPASAVHPAVLQQAPPGVSAPAVPPAGAGVQAQQGGVAQEGQQAGGADGSNESWVRLPNLGQLSAVQLWRLYAEGTAGQPAYAELERTTGPSWRMQPGTKGRGRKVWLRMKRVIAKVVQIANESFGGDCLKAAEHIDVQRQGQSLAMFEKRLP